MNKITTIGLDLAKHVFHVVGCDSRGKIIQKKMLRRGQVMAYFANQPVCLVAMEACASAHYWARQLQKLGHEVKLIPAQFVKGYLRGNKNDYNDAAAIAEAASRPEMRCVAVKDAEQQDIQALHRLRERTIVSRTALSNQLRGLLAEYGLILPRGLSVVRREIPRVLEDAGNGLSARFRRLLARGYDQLRELDEHIAFYTHELQRYGAEHEACQRLQSIPGFGPITASLFHSVVGDGRAYRRGRDVSASCGLVPRQHSSGGKQVLLGITKRGDRYLRSLLIHGARAVVIRAAGKTDKLSCWLNRLRAERGFNKAVVAMANKMARMGWAILAYNTTYQAAD